MLHSNLDYLVYKNIKVFGDKLMIMLLLPEFHMYNQHSVHLRIIFVCLFILFLVFHCSVVQYEMGNMDSAEEGS